MYVYECICVCLYVLVYALSVNIGYNNRRFCQGTFTSTPRALGESTENNLRSSNNPCCHGAHTSCAVQV